MAVRSGQNKDVLFCEYKQEMEKGANLNNSAGMVAEGAYEKTLEKKMVKLHGTLKTNVKKDDSIQVMLLNVNGINMSKRFNYKVDRLIDVINKYHLDPVGLQKVCVNWHAEVVGLQDPCLAVTHHGLMHRPVVVVVFFVLFGTWLYNQAMWSKAKGHKDQLMVAYIINSLAMYNTVWIARSASPNWC